MQGLGKTLASRMSIVLLIAVLVGSSVLMACGSSSTSTSTSSSTTSSASSGSTTTSSSSTEQAAATAIAKATGSPNVPQLQTVTALAPPVPQNGAAQPGAIQNAHLTFAYSAEDTSYDPGVDSEGGVYMQVWVPLLALTPDNKVAQSGAHSMSVSNDGKTYTFKLNKLVYSDGTPVTAQDYAYSLQRECSPTVAGTYSNVFYGIVGCQAWRTADTSKTSKADLTKLQQTVQGSIKALDDNTLQIQLKNPAGYFPYVLTLWMSDPVRKDLVEQGGKNWWQNTKLYIGDGPFMVTKHINNQEWDLVRNPHFALGKAGIAEITIKIIQTPATELLAYEKGELDFDTLSNAQYGTVESNPTLKKELLQLIDPSTYWISLDVADPPFNNLKVRQAFSYAMNRELYVKQVNNGIGTPAGTLLYKGLPGYQTKFQQTYDPSKAKQLLAQAGYPGGKGFPSVNFDFANNSDTAKKEAVFWGQQFKQILGVNIIPTPMDPVEIGNLYDQKSPQLKMAFGTWYQDYPHAQDWLSLLFANNSGIAPRGWNDPHFNELTNKADTLSVEAGAPLYAQAGAYLAEQAPALFFVHLADITLVKPYLKGYTTVIGQTYGFSYNTTFNTGALYEVQH